MADSAIEAIIRLLNEGPKTVPELVRAFRDEHNPSGIKIYPRTVKRLSRQLENYADAVIIGHCENEQKRTVRLLCRPTDLGLLKTGRYGRYRNITLPVDRLQTLIDEIQIHRGQKTLDLYDVLSQATMLRGERNKRATHPMQRPRTATISIRGLGSGGEMKAHKKSQPSSVLTSGPGQLKFKRKRVRD